VYRRHETNSYVLVIMKNNLNWNAKGDVSVCGKAKGALRIGNKEERSIIISGNHHHIHHYGCVISSLRPWAILQHFNETRC
jgi:hypothetical protein